MLATRLQGLIFALPDAPGEQDAMVAYNAAAAIVVAGGQHRAAQLALAYIGRQATARTTPSIGDALRPVLVTRESAVARSPVLRLWALLGEGATTVDAKTAASSYADALGSNDLQVAERAGLDEGARVADAHIVAWRKVLDPGCCEWCHKTSTRTYRSADSVPFHERDRCSAAPVLEGG